MNSFLAELVGTMFLILLGDGVVAAVVLSKSKAENSGWMVITTGWAMAVAMGVYVAGRISGGHINPAVTLGFGGDRQVPLERRAQVPGSTIPGSLSGRGHRVARLSCPLARDGRSGQETRGFLYRAGHSQASHLNLLTEFIATFVADVWCARHRRQHRILHKADSRRF